MKYVQLKGLSHVGILLQTDSSHAHGKYLVRLKGETSAERFKEIDQFITEQHYDAFVVQKPVETTKPKAARKK